MGYNDGVAKGQVTKILRTNFFNTVSSGVSRGRRREKSRGDPNERSKSRSTLTRILILNTNSNSKHSEIFKIFIHEFLSKKIF